jgi:hypothetical protein
MYERGRDSVRLAHCPCPGYHLSPHPFLGPCSVIVMVQNGIN